MNSVTSNAVNSALEGKENYVNLGELNKANLDDLLLYIYQTIDKTSVTGVGVWLGHSIFKFSSFRSGSEVEMLINLENDGYYRVLFINGSIYYKEQIATKNDLAQTMTKVASKQFAYEFQSIDTWETVDSILLGSGNFLIVFRMNWNYSKPIAIQIEDVAPTLANDELLPSITIVCCAEGGRTINFRAKGDAIGINNCYWCVYKFD